MVSTMSILTRIFGTHHDRLMKKLRPTIEQIAARESFYKKMTDSELKNQTVVFKEKLAQSATLDDILVDAFAVCREASSRVLGMRHYDVQMIGGLILHKGSIAEMRTGEGKTLVATLPVFLNGLSGKGAHVVTVNDYLAKRDSEWMGQLYKWMGLSVGTIVHNLTDSQRKVAYGSDITYGTNNEFGFDYLRDNMKFDPVNFVQRPLNFAIVDECDSILIDEARTPLIISGPSEDSVDKYYEINKIIPHLKRDLHFTMEEKSKTVSLTEEGNSKVEELLGVENVYDIKTIGLLHHIYQGLKAHYLYRRDVDYMVHNNEIIIVDEFTGRLMEGRRWSDGLHQAVEAKEAVNVRSESQTLATITFQNYFRMYKKLSGMTGTAETEAVEFKKIYNLDVVVIPTNQSIARVDRNDVIYKNEIAKFKAIANDILDKSKSGQPILVGTVSIEKSEIISRMLDSKGIKHKVLNAKHHEKEAEIVAQAGRFRAVTIATNMAGRGTDIVLGGNAEFMAKAEVTDVNSNEDSDEFKKALQKYKAQCEAEKQDVIKAGGLYIIGTERHEARRVDNQLRGRAGRQGDPGESKFYLCLDDDLLRIFNGETMKRIMERFNFPEDEPIEARMVNRSIEGAQRKVEGHNFDIRKHLLEFDDVMNQQRTIIYGLRREVLEGDFDNLERKILDLLGDTTSDLLDFYAPETAKPSNWDLKGLSVALNKQFGSDLAFSDSDVPTNQELTEIVSKEVKRIFEEQKSRLGTEIYQNVLKMFYLQTIDGLWKDHLKGVDKLKEGINLRAYAQKDPLVEYKKEAFNAFQHILTLIRAETVEKIIKVRVVSAEQIQDMKQEFDGSELDYAGGEDEPSVFQDPNMIMGMMKPREAQSYSTNLGDGGNSNDSLNREQRRRSEKKKKKIKL